MWRLLACSFGIVLHLPFVRSKSYNDCARVGPPDPGTTPIWNGAFDTFFDDYRPLVDIDKFVTQLQAAHPDLITFHEIGKSWEGRPLKVMQITNGGASVVSTKPAIYLQGGIHAREWIATATVLYLAYGLVSQAASPAIASMLNQYVFIIISPLNPDGYVYTWEANRYWRKTRSTREQCQSAMDKVAGVDPNRNWGFTRDIVSATPGGEQLGDLVNPCLDTYEGPAAESEPEVKAVADFLRQRQQNSFQTRTTDASGKTTPGPGYITAFIDYHSFCMFLLPPWGYSAIWPTPPDGAYMKSLSDAMAAKIRATSGRTFKVGPDLLPADPGTAPDWTYGELGVRASMTLELEGHEEGSSFCISKDRIKSVGNEQFQALGELVNQLRTQGDYPSMQFGIFAGSPPPPPVSAAPVGKWMVTDLLWSEKSSYRIGPIIGCIVFGVTLLGVGIWRRRLRTTQSEEHVHKDDAIE